MIVRTNELKDVVKHTLKVYRKNSEYDVEKNIRLQWDDDELIVSAYNYSQYLRIRMSISADDSADVLIDPAFLHNLLSTLGEVTKIERKRNKLVLSSGSSKLEMGVLSPEFYPDWSVQSGDEIVIDWYEVLLFCTQATIVARKNNDNPIKSAVFFTQIEDDIELVSADGVRLLYRKFPVSGSISDRFMIQGPDLISVKDIFNSDDEVHMFLDHHFMWFASKDAEIMMNTLEGKIPKYEPVLKLDRKVEAVVSRELLLNAINQANMYAIAENDEYLACEIDIDEDSITVRNDSGMKTVVPAEVTGDNFSVIMTPKMALEVIRSTKDEEIKLWASPPMIALFVETSETLFITMGRNTK